MHPMFLPENLYAMPRELVVKQVAAHRELLDNCNLWRVLRTSDEALMLAAIYHSGLDFDTFDCILRNAINAAEERIAEVMRND